MFFSLWLGMGHQYFQIWNFLCKRGLIWILWLYKKLLQKFKKWFNKTINEDSVIFLWIFTFFNSYLISLYGNKIYKICWIGNGTEFSPKFAFKRNTCTFIIYLNNYQIYLMFNVNKPCQILFIKRCFLSCNLFRSTRPKYMSCIMVAI